MSTELPLACSLPAAALGRREEEIGAVFREALAGARREGRRLTLTFRDAEGTLARVEALAAAERECCAFLDIAVRSEDAGPVLEIEAPAGAEEVLGGFAALAEGALRR